jgi:chemotaxis response regulator CheB
MKREDESKAAPGALSKGAFDIVGLAASAGGLRVLSEILAALPADFPAAIVIVQHLDPRHRSLIADILSRRTALHVEEAKEGVRLSPGMAYIAPPTGTCRSISTARFPSLDGSLLRQSPLPAACSSPALTGRMPKGSERLPNRTSGPLPTFVS